MRIPHRPRVALVYDRVYPLLKGGGERRFYEIGRRIAGDFEVGFFHYYSVPAGSPGIAHYTPIPVGGGCSMYTPGGRRSIRQGLDFALRLVRRLADFRPDIIDCSSVSYSAIPFCAAVAARTNAKLVITWHEYWDRYWFGYLPPFLATAAWLFERQMPRLAAENVAVSGFTARRLSRASGVAAQVIPNGVDLATIRAAAPSSERTDVLFVGRLIKEKRADLLLDAVASIAPSLSALRLTLVGEGPEQDRLRERMGALPSNVSAELVPSIPSEAELYGRMKSARLVVLPSEREGYGLVVAETQAAGSVPIVLRGPDNAAVDLIDHDHTGVVVDPTIPDLGAAIRCLLGDQSRRDELGRRAAQISAARDWSVAAEATAVLYGRLRRAHAASSGGRSAGTWTWRRISAGRRSLRRAARSSQSSFLA